MQDNFKLISDFQPAGDQPQAINKLAENITKGKEHQILLGVTGSGKTFTCAAAIEKLNMPALVISPNKVLASQLYGEFKSFFPKNAVEYFISFYDYYQPEAYIAQTDTYIEKDASINDHLDRLRLKATSSILQRKDVIVVASVSCIYNIGSPENFSNLCLYLRQGKPITRDALSRELVSIQFERNEVDFSAGKFRMKANYIDIFPQDTMHALRVYLDKGEISKIFELNAITGDQLAQLEQVWVYPAKQFISTRSEIERALVTIKTELGERERDLLSQNKLVEAQRIRQRTEYDMEMLAQLGYCSGIENYSRHLSGLPPGSRPFCLLDYFKKAYGDNFLVFIDESHVAVPQIGAMYKGDHSRKQNLVDFGFRLPSALDNRPLKADEFWKLVPQVIYISATPGTFELEKTGGKEDIHDNPLIAEQIIRPTGLVDPPVYIHPTQGQIAHLCAKIKEKVAKNQRTLVLSLTKKTAEDIAAYFKEQGIKAEYLHSDIESLDRIEIIKNFRLGKFDVLVGINLLREGLDIPETALVAILEADNEGFLRSETTIIQISGRTARNVDGEVILYADIMTNSMRRALNEMNRRREKQQAYNEKHNITPKTIFKQMQELTEFEKTAKTTGLNVINSLEEEQLTPGNLEQMAQTVEAQMRQASDNLDFETAIEYRERLTEIKEMLAAFKPKKTKKAPAKRTKK